MKHEEETLSDYEEQRRQEVGKEEALSETLEGFFILEYNEARHWLARFMEEGDEVRWQCLPYIYPHEYTQQASQRRTYDSIMEKVRRTAFFTLPKVKRVLSDMKFMAESNFWGWRKPDKEASRFLSWYREQYERFYERAIQNRDRIVESVEALS